MGGEGMRVLGVATARSTDHALELHEPSYCFEGLLGFADPVRADVPAAIAEAAQAGIAVAMITGDHPATALAAARAAGVDAEAGVLTGAEMPLALSPEQLQVRVFARIMPEQKLQLVRAFREAGHVVAMTGDGINDAPALAAADIGIAMGQRGTDVAREASDLILLDDRFASIVGGIRLGRRIFANLRRAMTYITAIHIPVAGLALLPILLGLPPLLYPMHLVLLELLIDPLCSLAFEGEASEKDAMTRPPRPKGEPLFGRRQLVAAVADGTVLLTCVFALYAGLLAGGHAAAPVRAAAFVALVAGQLSLALVSVSGGASLFDGRRVAFWGIAIAGAAVVAATLVVEPLPTILRFSAGEPRLLLAGAVVGLLSGGWVHLMRLLRALGTARWAGPQRPER